MRFLAAGYKVIAITDHVDRSNIKSTIKSLLEFTKHWPKNIGIKVLTGVELTHLPPAQFKPLAAYARKHGIQIIIAHGQTPVEPVIKSTNRAALNADIDILAHPGLITDEDVLLAKKRGIFLEITTRHGHCTTNAHVIKKALKYGAKLILNTDSHAPEDIISPQEMIRLARKEGLTLSQIDRIYKDVTVFLKRKGEK